MAAKYLTVAKLEPLQLLRNSLRNSFATDDRNRLKRCDTCFLISFFTITLITQSAIPTRSSLSSLSRNKRNDDVNTRL
jgi:hypothetical protein